MIFFFMHPVKKKKKSKDLKILLYKTKSTFVTTSTKRSCHMTDVMSSDVNASWTEFSEMFKPSYFSLVYFEKIY